MQFVRKKKQRSVKAAGRAKQLVMLEQESRAQAARLHWWIEVHMVLVQEPLRTGNDSEVVGRQADLIAACPWWSTNAQRGHGLTVTVRVCTVPLSVSGERPLTSLGLSDMLDRLSSVDPQVMKVPAVASSLPQFHHLETGRNFLDAL